MGNSTKHGQSRGGQSHKATAHTQAKAVRPHECSNCAPNTVKDGRLGRCKRGPIARAVQH